LEAPENTLAAFRRAIELGADLIELDVRQTADGHVVAIHDETVDRTTDGSGTVRDMPLAAVRELDAGSWMGRRFAGERVPTLREVLELTRGRIGLAIEIKAGSRRYPGIEATIVHLLQTTGRLDDVILISADCRAIRQVRRLDGRVATACFRHGSPRCWRWHRRLGLTRRWHSDYLFVWPERVTVAVVQEAHRNGMGIVTSLERQPTADPVEIRQLLHAGVDGVIADDVALLVRTLAAETAVVERGLS
jgi:glycerophosphoryl diester phosphodiesterase